MLIVGNARIKIKFQPDQILYSNFEDFSYTGVNQKVLPVLSTETLLHIWLSTEYYGFRPSSTAVDTVS